MQLSPPNGDPTTSKGLGSILGRAKQIKLITTDLSRVIALSNRYGNAAHSPCRGPIITCHRVIPQKVQLHVEVRLLCLQCSCSHHVDEGQQQTAEGPVPHNTHQDKTTTSTKRAAAVKRKF